MVSTIKRSFRSYNGRNFLSRWARKLFERDSIQKHIGYYLACGLLAAFLSEPAISIVSATQQIEQIAIPVMAEEMELPVKTETTLVWPVKNPLITQGYRYGHWGIDLQDKESTDIYPADKGWVLETNNWSWGYGKHVRVQHPNGRSSLYAHLNTIYVEKGQEVTRDTVLGEMGKTGWATGVHLHFEVYQDQQTLNPIEVLPENENVVWRPYIADSDVFHMASDSAMVTSETTK
jgi:murein DD-endopeptidase MepM/ murein hydrolase activator NlpD